MRKLWNRIKALHNDEQGADMVEYILIVAAIVLPIMGLVIVFRKQLWAKVLEWWNAISEDSPVDVG